MKLWHCGSTSELSVSNAEDVNKSDKTSPINTPRERSKSLYEGIVLHYAGIGE